VRIVYLGEAFSGSAVISFLGKFRDRLLTGEIFDTLIEARVLTERWRRE
jgi:hypothetical protein